MMGGKRACFVAEIAKIDAPRWPCRASLFAYSLAEYLYRPTCCSESW